MRLRPGLSRTPRRSERPSFEPIASTLRAEVLSHPGPGLSGRHGHRAVETYSGFVERRAEPLVEIACRRLGVDSLRGVRLLDLGCGFGALSAFFAFHGARVLGVDPNASRLEVGRRVATRHRLSVELERGRMEQLELPETSFEVAVMNNSLCYLVDPADRRRALEEALRVLVPGGVLVTRNPNRLHPVDQFTGIPLIHLLSPVRAVAAARRLGHERSLCRLVSPVSARREMADVGFERPRHHPTGAGWPSRPKLVTQYSHVSALRPAA